jgi:ATP-dependent DNA helicase RecQ
MVKVLAGWDWAQRPAGVMTLPSRTRPELIRSLGERIAEIGRLPYLGTLEYAVAAVAHGGDGAARLADDDIPAESARQHNSAHRLRALWHSLAVPGQISSAVAGLGGPVLLVDDQIETGWTMTVAARLLREAGATGVLPLVLAVTAG